MITLPHAAWAIVNSIWQGAVIAAIAWTALRLARRASAAVRYYVWAAVLVAALVLPIINLFAPERIITIAPEVAKQAQDVPTQPSAVHASVSVAPAPRQTVTHADLATTNAIAVHPKPSYVIAHPTQTLTKVRQTSATPLAAIASVRADLSRAISDVDLAAIAAGQWLQARIVFAFGLWLAIGALQFARLGWGLYRLSTIKRGLVRLDDPAVDAMRRSVSRPVAVAKSDEVGSPCVIGYAHPVIALPSSLVRTLDEADLHRVLAHELGHVRRFDDWANLVQQCIRAALFFNPIVHVACRALDVNREIACDDLVAAGHADRIEYAKCLTEIARRGAYVEHLVPAAGFFPDRGQIVVRIEQLLDRDHAGSARVGVVPAASAIAVIIAVAALAAHQLPALAISTPPAPKPPVSAPASAWAELDKARSAEAAALYQSANKEPSFAAEDVAALAQAQAALAVAHLNLTRVSAHATSAVLAEEPKIAMAMARSRIAIAPHIAAAMARSLSMVRPQIALAPRIAMMAAQSQLGLAPKAPQSSSEEDFLDALAAAGYSHLSVDDLIAIRNSGVTSSYLRALKQYGVLPMPAHTLIALADSGVSAATIASMAAAGYAGLKAEDLISLQNSGATLALVQSAKASLRPAPSVQDLVALANAGVTPEYIDALAKSGYAKLSAASIVKLQNAGVSSSYLIDLAKLGHVGMSVDSLIALANAGVSPDYIHALAGLGYSGVSTDDLIRMMNAGVTPDLIKRLRAHGFSETLSVDELIKLANNGF
ncbi:MAG TPA: M56 family metallopeptidase [Candidatus Eremiobacteraceae bacterium]|nr:M56 family metallopeptidase [Candidatus Eremiobacteraceae bacterium]